MQSIPIVNNAVLKASGPVVVAFFLVFVEGLPTLCVFGILLLKEFVVKVEFFAGFATTLHISNAKRSLH